VRAVSATYFVWCVEITTAEISAAFRIEDESRISFWDARLVAAALKGADRVLSEDFNAGQMISGLRIENPFAETTKSRDE
jgi:predicted nucleic acid-binding protein